jgi:hypothetical protein
MKIYFRSKVLRTAIAPELVTRDPSSASALAVLGKL